MHIGKMETLNKIAKSALIVFFSMIFAKAVGYIFRVIVARADIELYGLYNLGLVIITFLMFFALAGLSRGILRYVPYYQSRNDKEKADSTISTASKIVLGLSMFFSLLLFFFSDKISFFFGIDKLSSILKPFSVLIPVMAMSNIFANILTANKRIAHSTLPIYIVEPLLRVTIAIAFFSIGWMIFGLVIALLISNFAVLLLLFYYSKKHYRFRLDAFDKELIIFSFPLALITFSLIFMKSIDTIMLGYLTTIKEVALYNAALPTVMLLMIFPTSLLSVFLPIISEKNAKKANIGKEYYSVTKWIFISILPFASIMVFFGKKILSLLFGEAYAAAGIPLSILAVSYIFASWSMSSRHVLIMLKKTRQIFYYFFAALVINLILNVLLIKLADRLYGHGMYGAGLATAISFLLLSIFDYSLAYKYTKIKLFNKDYLKILLSAIVGLGIIYFVQKFVLMQSMWYYAFVFVVFIILYAVFLFIFSALDEQDKRTLTAIKSKLRLKWDIYLE